VNSFRDNTKSTRHVKRWLKSVRKLRNSELIALDYVHTSKNLADQFTKGLLHNVIEGASRELDSCLQRKRPQFSACTTVNQDQNVPKNFHYRVHAMAVLRPQRFISLDI
jgi:hypothetical protein